MKMVIILIKIVIILMILVMKITKYHSIWVKIYHF